ncbi:MAG: helix-turn-helix transcriptional regulator [Acholeplasmataceae bacterium]|nr:helix-turn-helix transcriptional regulator [Acholeplasmataceae bacterium]
MSDNSLLTNLVIELRRGTQIIAVLSQLKENQYGYSLLQKLEENHIVIEAGTLYPLLRRLESQGILSSEWDTTESRPRKYYHLSQLGDSILSDLKDEWMKLKNEMDELFKENSL